ncbi:MAG: hypothetical protein AAF495_00260 [Pseudomonadota bacterium]
MTKQRFMSTMVLGGALATGFIWSASSGVAPLPHGVSENVYRPIQSISYTLGSKQAIGYFAKGDGQCDVTMMVVETSDPELASPTSAARLRVSLNPGQQAGIDSVEGRTIEMICGNSADTLVVLDGDTKVFRATTN